MPQERQKNQFPKESSHPTYTIALAGNPNTGKSTLFNALTGLKQHTGNWPGKTVTRAEGDLVVEGRSFHIVDLPGTYSLLSMSTDEEVARNFILFGNPHCTIIVVDATCLERNLNLVFQILEITDKAVVALNMVDEAKRKGFEVSHMYLEKVLGVPVIPMVAKRKEGIKDLLKSVIAVIEGKRATHPYRLTLPEEIRGAVDHLVPEIQQIFPGIGNAQWIALRLLDGDSTIREELQKAALKRPTKSFSKGASLAREGIGMEHLADRIISQAERFRKSFRYTLHDMITESIYNDAQRIAFQAMRSSGRRYDTFDAAIDRFLTSPITGLPIMALGLAVVFWITISGANYPSELLAKFFFWFGNKGIQFFERIGSPWWLTGFLWDGVYRGLAWVVSVMLPPMAIFFPIFTILEDLGFLPRVAFNMDRLFKLCGAHGKQALSMSMGFGCNAAGVIAARIIDSPRERLIAILTNNFVPCNGRFPTLILIASLFAGAAVSPAMASLAAVATVVGVIILGVITTLIVSAILSKTILRGEPSVFTLELPPFRRPNILQVLYTSFIDRTLFVLRRAVIMAAPAGGVIWLLSNIPVSGHSLAYWISMGLDPFGRALGLDGVIVLAYIIAIPANEIVIPTILMIYLQADKMISIENFNSLREILISQQGWTIVTAICLMLFCLLHNPCSTTILTIWKETRNRRWTIFGALMPLGIAIMVTFFVAQLARLFGFAVH